MHQLHWDDWEMETTIACTEYSYVAGPPQKVGQVENAEVLKRKCGNGSAETEVRKPKYGNRSTKTKVQKPN